MLNQRVSGKWMRRVGGWENHTTFLLSRCFFWALDFEEAGGLVLYTNFRCGQGKTFDIFKFSKCLIDKWI